MPDHPELVSKKKYTDDFITAILYCYSYGFFFDDENGKKTIGNTEFSVQKSRIKKILVNYVDWDNLRMINKPSEAMKDNPFQRLYRFCRYIPVAEPSYYLHIIAALSPYFDNSDYDSFKLYDDDENKDDFLMLAASYTGLTEAEKAQLLDKKISARTRLDKTDIEYYRTIDDATIIDDATKAETKIDGATKIIKGFGLDERKECILIEALTKFLNKNYFKYTYFGGKEKTPEAHLKKLENVGVLSHKYAPGNTEHKRNRYWYLSQFTMDKIINEGSITDPQFKQHLYSALDFFSRYYTFGEIGVYLLDRMGAENNSLFRFRHEYFMQTLCDFHVIDLLNAIEKEKWCLIEYHHATADFDTKLLCYPLQIRVGSRNGREHLMYYDPIRHCYTALRIEFIKKITYYSFNKTEDILLRSGVVESEEALESEILNAKAGINYLWGVTSPSLPEVRQENNARVPTAPKHVTMLICYDPKKEYYIRNRMYRECGHGKVTELPETGLLQFDIDIAAPYELIPWVRSFYTRIVKLEGLNTARYTLENDLAVMKTILEDGELDPKGSSRSREIWSVPQNLLDRLGKGEEATGHDLVYNEIFSVYYYIFSDMLIDLTLNVAEGPSEDIKNAIHSARKKAVEKYNDRVGIYSQNYYEINLLDEVKQIFIDNNFFIKKHEKDGVKYSPFYKIDHQLDFYKEVLPLSIMEKRWLKTIMTDPKIYLFLSEGEVKHLKDLLATDADPVEPLPMDNIVCYDRYHVIRRKTEEGKAFSEKEINESYRHIISAILDGINRQVSLNIIYRDNYGEIIKGEFDPIVIEYSKRNNSFQGYFLLHDYSIESKDQSNNISFWVFNFSQIINISVSGNKFRHSEAEKKYDEFIEKNTAMVEFEFIDERNLADRILTELSPWRRECIKDGNHYRIKLHYRKGKGDDKGEELDIVIRLMSFGGYLKFKNMDKGSIGWQIKERVDKQLELIREKDKIKDDGESR